LPVTALWVGKLIIDQLIAAHNHPTESINALWPLVLAEFLIASCGAFLSRAIDYFDARMADRFSGEVGGRILKHASTLDLQSFEDPVFYDKLERARVQASDRIGMLNALGRLLQQVITLSCLSFGVLLYSPLIFVLLVSAIIPAFVGETHFAFLGYSLAYSLTPVKRELDYLRDLATHKESAKELKIFGLGSFLHRRFTMVNREIIDRNEKLRLRRLKAGGLLAMIGSLGYYLAYAMLVFETTRGELTIGQLTFLAGALAGSSTQIQLAFSTFTSIADHALYLSDLIEFFATKPKIRNRPVALPAPRAISEGIEFRNVSFSYTPHGRAVLKNVNLHIRPGERIALVGANGQGKTTLVKLMTHLYEPTSGQILLDGVDIREYDIEDLQRRIGVIFQDFVRYDMTVRENIAVGDADQEHDESSLMESVRKSGASEVLNRLPDGLHQMLGRRFEDGVDLSGGEWQRLALARAHLRDADILILDEPTAAMDAIAEYELFGRFAELTKGKIAVLISHRFSTVRMADRIVVLEDGVIREQGTHDDLIAQGGSYANMFELQAASYR
jgi:ATP-binding cassette subfamily B protein